MWCGAYRCVLGIGVARGLDVRLVLVQSDGRLSWERDYLG